MLVYILKNSINNQIIDGYDVEADAIAQKDNLLKTGEYRSITIDRIDIQSGANVQPLSVVRVEGQMTAGGPVVKVFAYNPTTAVNDKINFTVTARLITFDGYINLTASEQASPDVTALVSRISAYVESEFSIRIMNDNT